MEQQPGKGGSVDDRGQRKDEVIGRFDLNLAAAIGTRGGGHPAIRVARSEEKTGCGGRGAQHQHQRQGHQETRYPSHDHSPVEGLGIAEGLFIQDCMAAGPTGGSGSEGLTAVKSIRYSVLFIWDKSCSW